MMDHSTLAILGFIALFVLMVVRVPIGIAMGIVGVGGFSMIVNTNAGLNLLVNAPMRTMTAYTLSVLPMFVLMGVLASVGGMSRELFHASNAWFGHLRGGLATATVLASGGFAAVNGSSIACAATMTKVALPELESAGNKPGLSAGIIAAGGTLGVIIPPSVFLLLYGIITEQNVAVLFIAGIGPGLLAIGLYIGTIQILAYLNPEHLPAGKRSAMRERLASLRGIWAIMLLFLIIVVGMYGGFVTITEAAAVGAVGAFLIGVVRRQLDVRSTLQSLVQTLRITASIFTVAIGATLFGYFLAITRVTQNLTQFLVDLPIGPYPVLILVLIVFIILGAVMDELAVLLLTVPIVHPAMVALGFDPVWFTIVLVTTITVGMITPPVGMNVFVINSIARHIPLTDIYRGVMPFVAADFLRIALLCAFPWIVLFLPGMM